MKDGWLKRWLLKKWDSYIIHHRWQQIAKNSKLKIMDSKKTLAYIKKTRCSIARYGDGEFDHMYRETSEGYQAFSKPLADALINVLGNPSDNLLICIPEPMISDKNINKRGVKFWAWWGIENLEYISSRILEKTGEDYCFGDSFVSRPHTASKSKTYSAEIFNLWKSVWADRDVLIVEGEQTRLGCGNDLFSGANSIKRILAPAINAFETYPTILQTVLDIWNGELVIMALGPTATILASDLSTHNIQALDLGHIDIQYEWFLNGNDFEQVKGKYTNEAKNQSVEDYSDEAYLSQIIAKL